jgi:nucleoid-associated protein YgaU
MYAAEAPHIGEGIADSPGAQDQYHIGGTEMAKDDISHLPPDVQASIKASREKAKKGAAKKAAKKKDSSAGTAGGHMPAEARKAMEQAAAKKEEAKKKKASLGAAEAHIPPEAREAMERAAAKKDAASKKAAKTYVVKKGDSLSKIAKELLGDAARWPEIFEANKDQIKDPNLIYPGQEFRIP